MFMKIKRVSTKTLIIIFFTAFFTTVSIASNTYAEEKGLGVVTGTVKTKKAKYLKDAVAYIENKKTRKLQ